MKEQVIVPFEVKDGKVEEAKAAVRAFIKHIRAKEPGTLLYMSLQDKNNPNKFFHFMVFMDSQSHEHHRNTTYVQEFVDKLYPLCEEEPSPILLEKVDLCGLAAEALG